MASVGGAAAQGLESGFNLGLRQSEFEEQKRARSVQESLAQRAAARADALQERQTNWQDLQASGMQQQQLSDEGNQLLAQYGSADKIPADKMADYVSRRTAANQAHQQLLSKFIPAAQQEVQSAKNLFSDLQAGNTDLSKVPPDQMYRAIVAGTRRPIEDFQPGPNGEPSRVSQALNKLQTGLQTNNQQYVLDGVNDLFAPELKVGTGQPSPHGGTIVAKKIVALPPAPTDPNNPNDPNAGKVTPVVRVFVSNADPNAGIAEQRKMASLEQQQYGAPPGATGHYDAPVTQNRSTDPNDPVAHISIEDAIDRAHRLGAVASLFQNPEFQKYIDKGADTGKPNADAFLSAFFAGGGKMPARQETSQVIPATGGTLIRRDAQGREIGREVIAPATDTTKPPPIHNIIEGEQEQSMVWDPKQGKYVPIGVPGVRHPSSGGALAQRLKQIEESDLSDADKVQAKRTALMGAGAAGQGSREAIFTNRILIAANETAKDLANIVGLPIKSDTGIFGGRKQGGSLLDAGKEALTQALTTQEVQSYNTRSAGLQRSLSAIEAAGLAPTGMLSHQMEALQFRAGDSQQTRLEKLAQTRQIVEAGLETTLSNPKIGDEQRAHINDIITSLRKAIPFTIADVDKLGQLQESDPNTTLKDVMKANKLNKPQRAATPGGVGGRLAPVPGAPAVGTVQGGYRYMGGDPGIETSWEKVQ